MSPDGTRVLVNEVGHIGILTLAAASNTQRVTQSLIQTTFAERNPDISPDGRWVAYQSNESGSEQVYVRPFPKVDAGRWQVSTGSTGTRPLWSRSGRELFYWDVGGSAVMQVAVQTAGAMFSAGNPTKLFDGAPYLAASGLRTYDVSADGQRFLMIKNAESSNVGGAPSLVVVEHWIEELKARVGTK